MVDTINDSTPPPEEGGNRTFLIGVIILGGVFLIAVVGLVVAILLSRGPSTPAQQAPNLTATAFFQVVATQTAARSTQLQGASLTALVPPTSTNTPKPTNTIPPTSTPVVFSTILASATPQPSATTAATVTGTPPTATRTVLKTATALPTTGFGDSAGLPTLLIAGFALVGMIILVRQLRIQNARH